jgi:hypothetical protein
MWPFSQSLLKARLTEKEYSRELHKTKETSIEKPISLIATSLIITNEQNKHKHGRFSRLSNTYKSSSSTRISEFLDFYTGSGT